VEKSSVLARSVGPNTNFISLEVLAVAMAEADTGKTTNEVQAVDRAFEILEVIRNEDGVGVTELATALNVSKSTVHNHLQTMANRGYVIKEDGEYGLGLRLLSFPHTLQERNPIYQAAKPEVDELVERTDERCQVLVEENGHGIYIYQATGARSITTESYVGTRVELHSSAIGKALLAFQPDEIIDRVIERDGLPKRTEHTVTSPEAFKQELAEVRESGVAFDDEEGILGMRCVAAPIKNAEGVSVGAVSVSGPGTRVQGERFEEELPEEIRQTAQAISLKVRFS
jgi:DNA-binding IclR family transcriptional regulator